MVEGEAGGNSGGARVFLCGGQRGGEQRVQVGVALVEGEGKTAAGEQPGVFAPTGGGVGNGRVCQSAQGFWQGFAAATAEVVGEIEGERRVAVLPVAERSSRQCR